ncbi:hypothetical protein C8J57DRAFT_1322780 [Mycena rebaudengoi]|nr:hypothetical protein C8J57DRAFT_1322780 [Mycena rebaudengoi]
MTVKELDAVVRPKFQFILDESYRPLPFGELPVELALPILIYAAACSQGTYRSLLLTNKRIHDLVRIEALSSVPVILWKETQMKAFKFYLEQRPEVIPHIHYLWAIASSIIPYSFTPLCVSILNICTEIRALACQPDILLRSICAAPTLLHTHCVDLTLMEFRVAWTSFMERSSCGAAFFHQIERMHCIGPLDQSLWATWAVVPKLDNLRRLSVALGLHKHFNPAVFARVLTSPKLQQAVITTRLHGQDQQRLADAAREVDSRMSVMHRRKRWTETKLWHEVSQDKDRFWLQATKEKDEPPKPRLTVSAITA